MSKFTELDIKEFEQKVIVQKYEEQIVALNETINKLLKENDQLREIQTGINPNKLIKIHVTPEEEILDSQIARLQQISRTRALEINEVKMLDLYIKNKRLVTEKSTMNAEFKTIDDNMSTDDILRLVESEKSNANQIQSAVGSGEDPLE